MGTGSIFLLCLLSLCCLFLLLRLLSLRHSLREAAEELDEKLRTDTNTPVTISSGDRAMRALAAQLNVQLRALRRECLRLRNGDLELKNAVTNLSHDLRTPLTAICGYLELLEREERPEKAGEYLAVIRERTEALRSITEELLRYSVAASEAETLTRQPVCLNDILEQSLAGFYGALSARGIAPFVRIPEERIIRKLDPAALRRVFDNLLSNALKYTDGDLSVSLLPGGTVTFANGAARIGAVEVERLFDRFYTVETAGTSTGLGLSIARLLVRKMGGSIRADYAEGTLRICVAFPETAAGAQDAK